MKFCFLFLGLLIIHSCGNPHLTKKNSVIQATPRIETETPDEEQDEPEIPPEPPVVIERKVDFYVGAKEESYPYSGSVSTGFEAGLLQLKKNSLNDFEVGEYQSLDLFTQSYNVEFLHKTEFRYVSPEASSLEAIYSKEDYFFKVMAPVRSEASLGDGHGIETGSFDAFTKDVLLFNFSSPVKAFGAVFLDLESSVFLPAVLRVFDCSGKLVASKNVAYADGSDGNGEFRFVGFKAQNLEVCAFGVTVGDYANQNGVYRSVAIDEIVYEE